MLRMYSADWVARRHCHGQWRQPLLLMLRLLSAAGASCTHLSPSLLLCLASPAVLPAARALLLARPILPASFPGTPNFHPTPSAFMQ